MIIIKQKALTIWGLIFLILTCCVPAAQAKYCISYSNDAIRISSPSNRQDGFVQLKGTASIPEVWFCLRGPNNEYTKYRAEVVDGSFKTNIYLCFGPGEYTVWAGDNRYKFDGSIRFIINNLSDQDNRYISPSVYIDSDNQQIIALVDALGLSGLSDAEKAAKIHQWIAMNIAYDCSCAEMPWIPASQIIDQGSGVCKDYAVLFAAVARASGLTCRLVIGDVNINEKIIGLHAWNEVLIGDKWMPVDVTLDAGYLNSQAQFVFAYSTEYLFPDPALFALTHKPTSISFY